MASGESARRVAGLIDGSASAPRTFDSCRATFAPTHQPIENNGKEADMMPRESGVRGVFCRAEAV
jgi:hypothetical protein